MIKEKKYINPLKSITMDITDGKTLFYEKWMPVVGYENYYKVSNYSNIKRLERFKNNNGGLVKVPELILKQQITKKGYKTISISLNSKKKTLFVHRLVAMAFIPNPNNLPQVNHINEDKTYNSFQNLEWCTNRQNITHSKINSKSTSKYVGVHFIRQDKKWCSQINIQGITYHLGFFLNEIDAKLEYDNALQNWKTNNKKPFYNGRK